MAVHHVVRENHAPHFYGNVKLGLHISMETGPATQSPVAEVEPCSTSACWSRRPPVHAPATPWPATAPRQVAGLSSVAGRCVFGESAITACISLVTILVSQKLFIFYVVARTGTGPLCPLMHFSFFAHGVRSFPLLFFRASCIWLSCFIFGLLLFSPIVYD